jgi:hypothetical protein
VHCPNLLCCDEIAMFRGAIPKNGHRDPAIAIPLVQIKDRLGA